MTSGWGRAELLPPQQKVERLLAVAHQADPARHVALPQGVDGRPGVLEVVFHQQDFHRPAYRRRASWLLLPFGGRAELVAPAFKELGVAIDAAALIDPRRRRVAKDSVLCRCVSE